MDAVTHTEKELVPEAEKPEIPHKPKSADVSPVAPEQATESGSEHTEAKREMFYQKILSQIKGSGVTAQGDEAGSVRSDAQKIASMEDTESKVSRLVEIASTQGVDRAVKVARMLDFYILDQVHDQLANRFYDSLVEKGLIQSGSGSGLS